MLDVRDKMFYSDVSVMWKPSPLEGCISFMASTTDKMNARFQSIKEEFPNAEFVELDENFGYLLCTVRLGEYKDGDDALQKKIDENNRKLKELGYDI